MRRTRLVSTVRRGRSRRFAGGDSALVTRIRSHRSELLEARVAGSVTVKGRVDEQEHGVGLHYHSPATGGSGKSVTQTGVKVPARS